MKDIPHVLADLLQNASGAIGWHSERIETRLYPSPSLDSSEENLRQDWRTVVEPDLQEGFRSAREVMDADLRKMRTHEDGCILEIPLHHAPAWLNALNQIRLALAAEYDFSDSELSAPGPIDLRSERDRALLQINFFASIQHFLIEALEE